MMEASIHAVLLNATPVTVLALVWRLPSRAPGGMQLLGASACAAAGVLGANLFNLHMCSEGIAVAQWLFLAPCILALAFVEPRAWRRNLAGGVLLAMVGLSCHYTELVHHNGWTGNPASDGGSHALAQSFVRYAAEELANDAGVEDAVLPAGWLRESPAWAAVERVFRRGRFVRRSCGIAWHTPFTGLIPYEEIPQDFWFPGGSLKRDLHRLELRDRAE